MVRRWSLLATARRGAVFSILAGQLEDVQDKNSQVSHDSQERKQHERSVGFVEGMSD